MAARRTPGSTAKSNLSVTESESIFKAHQKWAESVAQQEMSRHSPESNQKLLPGQVVNAALVAMWKCSLKFDPERNIDFKMFAIKAVIGAARDQFRTSRLCGRSQISGEIREITSDIASDDDHETDSIESDNFETMLSACTALERDVLRMKYSKNMTHGEIAACLKIKKKKIVTIIKRAHGRIQRRIGRNSRISIGLGIPANTAGESATENFADYVKED